MTRLNTRPAIALLRTLNADQHDAAIGQALGRHAGLRTLAEAAEGTAVAIGELEERITPLASRFRWVRSDRRWNDVATALDAAARRADDLRYALVAAANASARIVTVGDLVEYAGSMASAHGSYYLAGICSCDDCLSHSYPTCLLARQLDGPPYLTCVNPSSITATPWPAEHASTAGRRLGAALLAAVDVLTYPVDADDAVAAVVQLRSVVGRLGYTVSTWDEKLTRHYTGRWAISPRGSGVLHDRAALLATLHALHGNTTAVVAALRRAMVSLCDIRENPAASKAA